jgi:hypothetical protein
VTDDRWTALSVRSLRRSRPARESEDLPAPHAPRAAAAPCCAAVAMTVERTCSIAPRVSALCTAHEAGQDVTKRATTFNQLVELSMKRGLFRHNGEHTRQLRQFAQDARPAAPRPSEVDRPLSGACLVGSGCHDESGPQHCRKALPARGRRAEQASLPKSASATSVLASFADAPESPRLGCAGYLAVIRLSPLQRHKGSWITADPQACKGDSFVRYTAGKEQRGAGDLVFCRWRALTSCGSLRTSCGLSADFRGPRSRFGNRRLPTAPGFL